MIGKVAGKCLDVIKAIEVLYPHRRPAQVIEAEWYRGIDELVMEVLKADETGGAWSRAYLQAMLECLREQYECFKGEQAVVDMGMTTFAHLDGFEGGGRWAF